MHHALSAASSMSELFSAIVGHTRVKELLVRAARGTPSHSYLFFGPEGVGKMLMARAFVRALVCPKAIDGCQCPSCRLVEAGTHPDLRLLSLGDESIKLEETRHLRKSSMMSPILSPYHINVIDQADRLTAEACASLLKLLEEPPLAVVNILVSARPDALPATIRSRCLEIPFGYLSRVDLTAHLEARGVGSSLRSRGDALPEPELLARVAGGRMGEALRWNEPEAWKRRRRYLEISWEVAAGTPSFDQSDAILKEKDKRAAVDFLRTLYCAWRDLSLWCIEPQAVINTDQTQHLAQIATRRSYVVWASGCRLIEDVLGLTTSPVNMGMLLPVLLFQLSTSGTSRVLHEDTGPTLKQGN
ncbi:MAG: AAA family ATPase [Coprothermobacterota bacterium]|nr:AAA family ATPase [Coprothermobacterota bacterium]